MLIEEKNDPGFVEYDSRIEPPLTTLNAENLDDDNYNQAIDRSGGKFGNKGYDCAAAAAQMSII